MVLIAVTQHTQTGGSGSRYYADYELRIHVDWTGSRSDLLLPTSTAGAELQENKRCSGIARLSFAFGRFLLRISAGEIDCPKVLHDKRLHENAGIVP
jgi:hypothetical protein